MRFIILVTLVILIIAVFSAQNSRPVSISVLAWSFEAPLAIIMLLSVVFGMIVGLVSSFAFRSARKQKNRTRQPMMPGRIE